MADLTNQLSAADKVEWICEHYHGGYELFIDPVGLFDRIAELEEREEQLRKALGFYAVMDRHPREVVIATVVDQDNGKKARVALGIHDDSPNEYQSPS